MRPSITTKAQAVISAGVEALKDDFKRLYSVSGTIVFVFNSNAHISRQLLERAIRVADERFPWLDTSDRPWPGDKWPSIKFLSGGEVSAHMHPPHQICEFWIVPHFENMRKEQVFAYKRYLENIAKILAESNFMGVQEVRAVLEMQSVTCFKRQ